jgi:hypothetical protein
VMFARMVMFVADVADARLLSVMVDASVSCFSSVRNHVIG